MKRGQNATVYFEMFFIVNYYNVKAAHHKWQQYFSETVHDLSLLSAFHTSRLTSWHPITFDYVLWHFVPDSHYIHVFNILTNFSLF